MGDANAAFHCGQERYPCTGDVRLYFRSESACRPFRVSILSSANREQVTSRFRLQVLIGSLFCFAFICCELV